MNPMRSILLAMAASTIARRLMTSWSVTHRVVRRFIPGETLDEAIAAVSTINADGATATLNPLGENVRDLDEAAAATAIYVEILERVASEGLDCNVSLKLTMLGLEIDAGEAERNLLRVLEVAAADGNFVRIDMESSATVDRTLEIYRRVRTQHDNVGVVIQSYLRRSLADVEALLAMGASIRVVKGAYAEPPEIAFPDKRDVDRGFARILARLTEPDAQQAGARAAIASHDPALIAYGRRLIDTQGLPDWEFQMLYGIGRELQRELLRDGYRLRIYVSYGPSWYPWFMRRLAERPANIGFFLRHLRR